MEQILESLSVFVISPFEDKFAGIMWCIFLAVILVFVSTLRQRATLGKAVKALQEKGCATAETALSAEELGKIPSSALKTRDRLIRTVTEEGKPVRYFLPEENRKKAETLLKATSTPIWLAILEIAALYVVLAILYHLLPWLLDQF